MRIKNKRKRYPEDEKRYPWLSILLNTYHLIDIEYLKYINEDQKKRNKRIACKKGCYTCCIKHSVPISQPEIQGISWYVIEKLKGLLRVRVKEQLKMFNEIEHCPFLVNKVCAIYPVRPIACRVFFVYTRPCLPDEDLLSSRLSDILPPNREISKKSALVLFPLFEITELDEQIEAFENGLLLELSRPMHEIDWSAMSEGIAIFDLRNRSR
jgi:Fe-S-cluster containining protein